MSIKIYKNVKIGKVPVTPATPHTAEPTLDAYESLIEHSFGLGYAISYRQEQQGRLVQNIVPVHKTEFQQISTSSKVELALHTETAFHPYKPDYVLLLCLRGDPNAVTTYADLNDIISELDKKTIDDLQKTWYLTGVDDSFRTLGEPYREFQLSVLTKNKDGYSMSYDEALMRGMNQRAETALKNLSTAIKKCTREIVLETGDLLVIDNNTTIHGRKPFQPKYDGTDRWVQRLLVKKDLPPEDQIDGHIINTNFNLV